MADIEYEEEDPPLASVMDAATAHLRDLLPAALYRELRYDVGLMAELHPETGTILESLRHANTNVDASGPLDEQDTPAEERSESA